MFNSITDDILLMRLKFLFFFCSSSKTVRPPIGEKKKKINLRRMISKLNKDKGVEYLTYSGVARAGRQLRPPCHELCRSKCQAKVTEEQRQKLFKEYYAFGSLPLQWVYIAKNTDRTLPKQRLRQGQRFKNVDFIPRKERKSNIRYYLTIAGERIQVCQRMFHNTFDITKDIVNTALRKTNASCELIDIDRRGGRHRSQKLLQKIE